MEGNKEISGDLLAFLSKKTTRPPINKSRSNLDIAKFQALNFLAKESPITEKTLIVFLIMAAKDGWRGHCVTEET